MELWGGMGKKEKTFWFWAEGCSFAQSLLAGVGVLGVSPRYFGPVSALGSRLCEVERGQMLPKRGTQGGLPHTCTQAQYPSPTGTRQSSYLGLQCHPHMETREDTEGCPGHQALLLGLGCCCPNPLLWAGTVIPASPWSMVLSYCHYLH